MNSDYEDQPSTNNLDVEDDYFEDLQLNFKDDDAEITRLQLPNENTIAETKQLEDDEREARLEFHCTSCDMHERADYFGQKAPFMQGGVEFVEDTYIMRDPFQPPLPRWKTKPEYFIGLGAPCCKCTKVVCKDNGCSFFYTRTYCLSCAFTNLSKFPLETQAKIRKQMADKK